MMESLANAVTRVSRHIAASPAALYDAFMDPAVLVEWLPPGEMTGRIHAFDPTVGGGYRMSLFYPAVPAGAERKQGKTHANEDMVSVRFEELAPPHRIVETVRFHSDDPALQGAMTIVITFKEVPRREAAGKEAADGTEVTFLCTNLPPGLRPEDNELGCRQSLEQLARRFA